MELNRLRIFGFVGTVHELHASTPSQELIDMSMQLRTGFREITRHLCLDFAVPIENLADHLYDVALTPELPDWHRPRLLTIASEVDLRTAHGVIAASKKSISSFLPLLSASASRRTLTARVFDLPLYLMRGTSNGARHAHLYQLITDMNHDLQIMEQELFEICLWWEKLHDLIKVSDAPIQEVLEYSRRLFADVWKKFGIEARQFSDILAGIYRDLRIGLQPELPPDSFDARIYSKPHWRGNLRRAEPYSDESE